MVRFQAGNDLDGDVIPQVALYAGEVRQVRSRNKGNRGARGPGPAGPSNAVDVILRRAREVEIDYMADAGNIKATAGHIGRYQEPDLSFSHIHDGSHAS